MSGWRDIATAPKDGTQVLLVEGLFGRAVVSARWISAPHDFWRKDSGGAAHRPTHWMPLPKLPEQSA